MPAFSEIVFIMVLALVVIGPKQLPGLARTIGRFLNELRRATDGVMSEINKEARKIGDATGINEMKEHLKTPEILKELKVPEVKISDLKPMDKSKFLASADEAKQTPKFEIKK
jgi:sec-independent protein translocase protein TatB